MKSNNDECILYRMPKRNNQTQNIDSDKEAWLLAECHKIVDGWIAQDVGKPSIRVTVAEAVRNAFILLRRVDRKAAMVDIEAKFKIELSCAVDSTAASKDKVLIEMLRQYPNSTLNNIGKMIIAEHMRM